MSLEQAHAAREWPYAEAKAEAEARVVRWAWATFTRWSIEPAYFEINRHRRGDPLDREPDPPFSGAHGHGFDVEGRLCVERQQTEFPGRFYETFYGIREGGIARRHFGHAPTKNEINTSFFELDGERIVRSDTLYARGTVRTELFSYDTRGRLTTVEIDGPGDIQSARDIDWNDDLIVRVFWRYPDGRRQVHYERPGPTDTFAARRADVEKVLVEGIMATLAAAKPNDPIYAIALWWCCAEYQQRFPPNLAIATASQREAFVHQHASRAKDFLWSPPEWGHDLHIALDAKDRELCDLVNQDVWQRNLQDEADTLLARVAATLGAMDLPIVSTADVVTFAVQVDAAERDAEQLSRQLTPERRAAFAKARLL